MASVRLSHQISPSVRVFEVTYDRVVEGNNGSRWFKITTTDLWGFRQPHCIFVTTWTGARGTLGKGKGEGGGELCFDQLVVGR